MEKAKCILLLKKARTSLTSLISASGEQDETVKNTTTKMIDSIDKMTRSVLTEYMTGILEKIIEINKGYYDINDSLFSLYIDKKTKITI